MKYDLIITARGVRAMRYGYHEEVSGLSLAPYNTNNYVEITTNNGDVYRVHKNDMDKVSIKQFLNRVIK